MAVSTAASRARFLSAGFRKREWIATIKIRGAIEPDRTCSSTSLRVIYRDLCCTKLSAQLMTLGELCANDYRCGDRAKVRPGGASAKCDTSIIRKGNSLRGSLAHLEQRASPSPSPHGNEKIDCNAGVRRYDHMYE